VGIVTLVGTKDNCYTATRIVLSTLTNTLDMFNVSTMTANISMLYIFSQDIEVLDNKLSAEFLVFLLNSIWVISYFVVIS